ncbi:PREDICTED: protein WHI3 isoform X3 [Ipomoea nil]|uniref:protein WHI3 isoform X3 n=1 Tax=Ipomoea nil TaxID=35883 RepID=UPI00090099C0|nr:PREDICTED: protein WHI3 isoform X3 [Ipomoea nil]
MALHQPYDPYYRPQPLPIPDYGYTVGNKNERDMIRTLFVSGLPDDVKAREIHNLFRRRPGFESCQLKYTGRGDQVVAFATFVDHQSAMAALHSLNGVKFDPQTGSTLHIEIARSNSRRTKRPGSGPYVVIDNRSKSNTDAKGTSSDEDSNDSDSDDPSRSNDPDSGNNDDSSEKSGEKVGDGDNVLAAQSVSAAQSIEKIGDGTHPCSTLFIANLGPNCTEDELRKILSQYPGFNTLKVRARGGMPVAFADFEGVEEATQVMNALQGSSLPSSDRGGMHIEYARSKMRKP